MFAVSLVQFVHLIFTASLVHSRGELAQRFVSQGTGVQQRRDQSSRSFTPMVVTSITSTASRDVQ
jgi:hypothetical protein